ncbi:MAG: hypothetical protein AB7L90_08110 [Hyphomicrobiaceae bacterium]
MVILPLLCSGCSVDTSTLKVATNALSSPQAPASTTVSVPDPPVDVYARIARGALKCWFGPEGSLKKTYVFHAKVDPPSAGKGAEIAVHTRTEGSSHGVLRAFAIAITPAGSGSIVEAQNIRFERSQAQLMIADVGRWSTGDEDCSVVGTGGWNPAAGQSPGTVPPPGTAPASPSKR